MSPRVLHVADLHQGLVVHSWSDPATGIPSRLLDVGRCWHRAAEIAVERGVDAVIVAGDAFHGRNPDAVSLNLFEEGLRTLEHAGIPTVLIAGNHDGAMTPGRPSIIEVFASEHVRVVTRPEVVDLDGLRIACLPWVSRQQLLANHPGMSRSEAVVAMADGLVQVIDSLAAEGADILTGHWSIQGAVLGNEKDIAIVGDAEPVIPAAALSGPWGYVALGHIHKQQSGIVDMATWAYAGSVDRMNFGEEHEEKVALEFDTATTKHTVDKHVLPARRFVTLEADDAYDESLGVDVEGAIVRVRIALEEEALPAFDRSWIEARLLAVGAARVYVNVDVTHAIRARNERVTSQLGIPEAMAEWFDLREISEPERGQLLELAKQLEEEVQS